MRVVDHHGRVFVKADIGAVATPVFLARADDDRLHNFALLHGSVGRCFFDGCGDDVAQAGLLAQSTAQGQNHLQLARAGVVGHRQHGSHLHCHGFFS